MERKIGIVVDSTTKTNFKETLFNDASVVDLSILVDGEEYIDGTLTNAQVLDFIAQKKKVTTSQPSPEKFARGYEEQFELGYESIICITISKGLSGTINSAHLAAQSFADKKIVVIDSMTVGPGVEILLEEAYKLINAGLSLEEVVAGINKKANEITLFLSIEQLAVLVAGGRLSKLQAMIGNILKVKPILQFKQGVLSVFKKVRGIDAIYEFIADQVKELFDKAGSALGKIAYVGNEEKAVFLKELIAKKVKQAQVTISGAISPVVATHLGYDGLGIVIV